MPENYSYLLLFILLFISKNSFAQHEVTGLVVDGNGNAIPYATTILLHAADSTVYKGAFSEEDGSFNFSEVKKGAYILKATYVGYEDVHRSLNVSENIDLGSIALVESTDNLDEVIIRANKPTVSRAVDRLIFNVENTSLSTGNTWDILKKTPGVLVMEDEIRIRNSNVTVYINDRKVHLSASELRELLENYTATNIKSVEVLTNPPAKYEAEGGAVLNIVTSKNILPGYKGSINTSYAQAIFPKYSLGTSHFFKNEKIDFFADYSYNPRKEFKDDDSFINFKNEEGETFSKWRTDFHRTTRSQAHQANLVLDYNLTERDIVSISSNFLYSPNKTFNNRMNTYIFNSENLLDSTLVSTGRLENDQRNLALDLGYRHNFDNGSQFSVIGHYTNFDEQQNQDVSSNYFNPAGALLNNISFSTNAKQNIHIYTAQTDYTMAMAAGTLETGAKASFINSNSAMDFFNFENGATVFIPGQSDNFVYEEEVLAAYASWEKNWDKWSVKAGLRGEQTNRTGESLVLNEINEYNFFDIFPTFYLQHSISENHIVTFDYGRRIERPRYESLNPFRYYLNENNFNAGNPNLRAARSNNFNLNYTYKASYFFDVYYRDNGKSPTNLVFQDNEDLTIRTVYANLLESTSYGLDFTHGRYLTNNWYIYGYVSAFSEEEVFLAVESDNEAVSNSVKGIFLQLYNFINITSDGTFSGEVSFVHWPTFIQGSYKVEPKTTLSIGLRKTLWKRRAELTLNLEDILNTTNSELISRYKNQDNGYFAQPESRYVRVGFKYNFGNFRLEDNSRQIEAEERDRL